MLFSLGWPVGRTPSLPASPARGAWSRTQPKVEMRSYYRAAVALFRQVIDFKVYLEKLLDDGRQPGQWPGRRPLARRELYWRQRGGLR